MACLQCGMHQTFRHLWSGNAVSQHMHPKTVLVVVCGNFDSRQHSAENRGQNSQTKGDQKLVQYILDGVGRELRFQKDGLHVVQRRCDCLAQLDFLAVKRPECIDGQKQQHAHQNLQDDCTPVDCPDLDFSVPAPLGVSLCCTLRQQQ